ncbi:hypothetical protein F4604DRAFT_1934121 [Suillus subluteus]|nr:hypothetical protein F4604DRAFT_1934121 [Suillus subluteus]
MDFTTGFLDDPLYLLTLHARRYVRSINACLLIQVKSPLVIPVYKREALSIAGKSGPVDLNAPHIVYIAKDDKAIDEFHCDIVQTTWHSVRMMMEDDARLNVYGEANLKVADISIAPSNVGTVGTEQRIIDALSDASYSTALLIGDKVAMIIGEDLDIGCRL